MKIKNNSNGGRISYMLALTALGCMFFVQGVSAKEREPEKLPPIGESAYTVEEYDCTELGIERPAGLCAAGGKVYICDFDMGTIVVFDKEMNFQQTIGELGMGEGEFMEPMDVEVTEDHIYVLDAGNSRVQILTLDGEYEEEIELTSVPDGLDMFGYYSLAVDENGNICVSTNKADRAVSRVRVYKDGDKIVPEGNMIGCVFYRDNAFYALDMMEYYRSGRSEGGQTGSNYLYKVGEEKLEQTAEFPYMYGPTDAVVLDGNVYVFSGTWGRIDRMSMDGEIEESVTLLPAGGINLRMGAEDSEHFYVSEVNKEKNRKKIYYIYK